MRLFNVSALILWLSAPLLLTAQSFPEENSVAWRGVVYGIAGPIPFAEVMCGDTTINTIKYNKIYQVNYNFDGTVYNTFYHACTRVDGQKVWVIAGGANQETLLYDFGVEVGDTLHLQVVGDDWDIDYYTESVEEIMIEGSLHKKIRFQTSYGIPDVWIEGIGSIMGPLGRGFFVVDAQPALTCYLENGTVIYKVEENQTCESGLTCAVITSNQEAKAFSEVEIFPNPASEAIWVHMAGLQGDFELSIFSAGGQRMSDQIVQGAQRVRINTSDLSPGFYLLKLSAIATPGVCQYYKIAVIR